MLIVFAVFFIGIFASLIAGIPALFGKKSPPESLARRLSWRIALSILLLILLLISWSMGWIRPNGLAIIS